MICSYCDTEFDSAKGYFVFKRKEYTLEPFSPEPLGLDYVIVCSKRCVTKH